MQQIGLLSGTFDPIHDGHLALAANALRQLGLNEVWVLVNADPEHKTGVTGFVHRLEMARRAVDGVHGVIADREPVQRQPQSHSIATARQLVSDYPNIRFTLIMGSDTFSGLDRWESPAELFSLMDVAVAQRPGSNASDIPAMQQRLGTAARLLRYREIDMPPMPVSSQTVKEQLQGGATTSEVPVAVQQYSTEHGLY